MEGGLEGRKGWMGTKAHACFSLLVSHGFVFMNGFALVALREIVLSSLLTASILSLCPCLHRAVSFFEGTCRAITVRMEDGRESIFLTVLVVDPSENKFGMLPWYPAKNQARRSGGSTKCNIDICRKIIDLVSRLAIFSRLLFLCYLRILCSKVNYDRLAQNLSSI